jgi:hypothetical protein
VIANSRVIFGDEVTPDMTLLVECEERYCRYPGEHGPATDHEATILRLRRSESGGVAYVVVVDANGQQHGWDALRNDQVRIVASGAETEPAEVLRLRNATEDDVPAVTA